MNKNMKCSKCNQNMKKIFIFHSHLNLFKPLTFYTFKIIPHIHQLWHCVDCKYKVVIDEDTELYETDNICNRKYTYRK